MVGVVLMTVGCSKASAPTASTREAAAKALEAQGHSLKFTTRGEDKEILVVHYPATNFEPCEEALARMEPDPEWTRDSTARVRDLKDMFKQEVTPEMKAQMDAMRKLVSQFLRIECETKTGAIVEIHVL
jgi:hypothetical protein